MTQTKQLNEIFEVAKGKKVKIINQKTEKSIPYLLIDTLRGKEPEFFTEDKKYTLAEEKDILMVFDGANSGLVGTGLKGAVGSTIARLRLKKDMNTKYITYFLSFNFSNLNQDIKGSAIPHIKPRKLLELNIRYPPLPEQSIIVSAIETQFTRLDEAVKSLKSVKDKLETYRKAVLKKAFEKENGWEEKKIKDVCEIKGGKRVPKGDNFSETKTAHPYLRVVDFSNYSINQNELCYISEETFKKISRYIIQDKEVFISIAGTIGRVGMIPSSLNGGNLTENAAKLTNFKNIYPKFIMYYLASPYLEQIINFSTKSTSQPKLALFRIGNMSINFPSLEEQSLIVSQIESKFSVIDKVEEVVEQSLKKAEMLRKSILKSAFEGKLVKS